MVIEWERKQRCFQVMLGEAFQRPEMLELKA
jgi:hypothetical protein